MKSKSNLILMVAFVLLISLGGLYFAIQSWMPFMWFLFTPAVLGILAWFVIERKLLADFFMIGTYIMMWVSLFIFLFFLSISFFILPSYSLVFFEKSYYSTF